MILRSAEEVAVLLAVMFRRSDEKRVRISEKTLRLIGNRTNLRAAFITRVIEKLSDMGLIMTELDAGGFGLIPAKSLEAAKTITAKRMFDEDELRALKNGNSLDIDALWDEAMPDDSGENTTDE